MSNPAAEAVVQFPNSDDAEDILDRTGQSILGSLGEAAASLNRNIQNTVAVSQRLSLELRDAHDRIRELEAQIEGYKNRADRAEQWLRYISQEIEQRFFGSSANRSDQKQSSGPIPFAKRRQARSG